MRVAFHTLGCKVNHYETEAMREAFAARGAVTVGEDEPADVYIVNTCTVTNIADRKSRQFIRRARRTSPDALIVVTGCYAQVEAEAVAALPEVDMVVGNGQKAEICGLVMARLSENSKDKGETEIRVLARNELTSYEDMGLVTSAEPGMTRAYVKIQEGCDRFCSYCLIPFARGPVRSRSADEIVREVGMLVASGCREIVLTGINTALYGTEEGFPVEDPDKSALEDVLARLDAMEGDFRIRLSSLEPTVVDKDDVGRIIRFEKLCHHLHLSVQSGSTSVLKSMNRHYTREDYLEIVRAIREFDPLYGITTDIIVGFPGETDSDFDDTLDMVRRADFGKVHVFRYSPRKGTAGASLPDAVPGVVSNERSDILEREAGITAKNFMEKNLGTVKTVLLEEERQGYLSGYTGNYIKVYVEDADASRLGEFCRVKLIQTYGDGCKAVLVE